MVDAGRRFTFNLSGLHSYALDLRPFGITDSRNVFTWDHKAFAEAVIVHLSDLPLDKNRFGARDGDQITFMTQTL